MPSLQQRIGADEVFYDTGIVSHGFTDYARDYDVVIDVPAAMPTELRTRLAPSFIKYRYRYRFTHCPEAHVTTSVGWTSWGESWDDVFTDSRAWEAAGSPRGFVWGRSWANTDPGLSYVPDSALAAEWSRRIGREMHEVTIETNLWEIRLVCHDLRIAQIAVGDPRSGELTPLDPGSA